jgi:hypothetical protein
MIAMSSRVHIFARPETRDRVLMFYGEVLGGDPIPVFRGAERQVLAFGFSNGTSLSVGFTEDALDDEAARRGAWLELTTDAPAELKRKVLVAGLPRVDYPGSDVFYFQAPGGQVWRIAAPDGRLVAARDSGDDVR